MGLAERRRRQARREKGTRDKCTLPTIPLGPAGRRPGPSDDDDEEDEEDEEEEDVELIDCPTQLICIWIFIC